VIILDNGEIISIGLRMKSHETLLFEVKMKLLMKKRFFIRRNMRGIYTVSENQRGKRVNRHGIAF
jgi:hypothetical protein